MSIETKPEWGRAIEEFRVAADRFVQALSTSSIKESTLGEFLKRVELSLIDIYRAALLIPEVEPETTEIDDSKIPREELDPICRALQEKLGKSDVYWSIFDSTEKSEPYEALISMDLIEIYQDIRESLLMLEKNRPTADVLWSLRFDCTSHWGRHLTSVLRAIYCLHAN
jgi:hypothetical protein